MPPIRGPSQRSRRVAPKYPRTPNPQDRPAVSPPSPPVSERRPGVTYPLCMHAPGRLRGRRLWLPLLGAALAVAAVCVVAVLRPGTTADPVAAGGVEAPIAAAAPAALVLPDEARVLV